MGGIMVRDLCFEIIQKCPNECVFCSSNASYQEDTIISLEMFKEVIDHFMKFGGIYEVSLSGGEPFLHPDLYNMILYCKTLGIRTVLFTSGVRRNIRLNDFEMAMLDQKVEQRYWNWPIEERKKAVKWEHEINLRANQREFNAIYRDEMNYLKWAGVDKIVFDLQGSSAETYQGLMGTDHFDYVMTSIMRAHVAGLKTDVHFVPMKKNYLEFPKLLEMLNIAGADSLSILNFVPQGRGLENQESLMLSDEEMASFRKIFLASQDSFHGKIRIGIPLLGEDLHKCTAGFGKLVIKYDGTVLPCPAFKEYDIGKLRKIGIPVWNIYEDLDKICVYEGTRSKPLCKKLYQMDRSIC